MYENTRWSVTLCICIGLEMKKFWKCMCLLFNLSLCILYKFYSIINWRKTIYDNCTCLYHLQQLQRKRHIGNDIITFVFQVNVLFNLNFFKCPLSVLTNQSYFSQDENTPFCPSSIRSSFLHIFFVVQVVEPYTNNTRYKVSMVLLYLRSCTECFSCIYCCAIFCSKKVQTFQCKKFFIYRLLSLQRKTFLNLVPVFQILLYFPKCVSDVSSHFFSYRRKQLLSKHV